MPGSSSVRGRFARRANGGRIAYRLLGCGFGVIGAYALLAFAEGLVQREVRPLFLLFGVLMGVTAVGLLLAKGWGRLLALIIAVGNAGLGVLMLLAAIPRGEVSPLAPALFLAINALLAYWLTRPSFFPTADG